MIYDILVNCNLSWHPVAAVQYTFTHKQYTEDKTTQTTRINWVKFLVSHFLLKLY